MKCLYIDTSNSGIAGDMFLASLLDLVPNPEKILKDIERIKTFLVGVDELSLSQRKIESNGIQLNQLQIQIKEDKTNHTPKAMIEAIENYIDKTPAFKACKEYALNVLKTMIYAEGEVHGKKIEDIHLHELSSVDTLIDILGVAACLNELGVFKGELSIYLSILPLGAGVVKTVHGILPVPAPATLKILEKSNIITTGGPVDSELVTPTGAALLVNIKPISVDSMPNMIIKKVSYSTGQKKFETFPNILRIFYGESTLIQEEEVLGYYKPYLEKVSIIETNLDDVSGEIIGHFINSLEKDKYLDIQIIPSLTKKNRPSHIIQLLCHPKDTFFLIDKIINELGTLGVRYSVTKRICIERDFKTLDLKIIDKEYPITFKIAYIKVNNEIKILNVKPEYEDLKKVSKESGLSLKKIMILCQLKITELYKLNI
ncbi:MAG: nickel pincer cofactor biosynthesis protein LarC [Candidatus Hermodarchaeota archaeon]